MILMGPFQLRTFCDSVETQSECTATTLVVWISPYPTSSCWESRAESVFRVTGFQFLVRKSILETLSTRHWCGCRRFLNVECGRKLIWLNKQWLTWKMGSSSQRKTVTCAVLFRWLKAVLAKFPASVKGRSVIEIDGTASFHISKQILSYTVSSFIWLLGMVILPVW